MSKLNVDQKAIGDLLSDKRSDFLIPDYQRPYAWGENECSTLWDDLYAFTIPNNNYEEFDPNDEYFLGSIVTFKNDNNKLEVIDGQQRLTTIMLLLRAFYDKFVNQNDENSKTLKNRIALCVWKANEFDKPDTDKLKIDSEVASDEDKHEFLNILRTGAAIDMEKKNTYQSAYAYNFRFFQEKISELVEHAPKHVEYFATRILKNVILLPVEAENQNTALQIFSTLNDRGLPLSDADIFKSQLYKYFSGQNRKDEFIERWKELEKIANETFSSQRLTPMDELFTQYMYYERALEGNRKSTTQALRDFYGRNNYALLKHENILSNLEDLAQFWNDINSQSKSHFTERVLKSLFILHYAPNRMWTYILSVYFLANRNSENKLSEPELYVFLRKMIGFILGYGLNSSGVSSFRGPIYREMINMVQKKTVTFARFESEDIRRNFKTQKFTNNRPITRSILTWWAFNDPDQPLLQMNTELQIEHIYANRLNKQHPLTNSNNFESLGNKSILEKTVNIRASDYRFVDKKRYYQGSTTERGQNRGTKIRELVWLANTRDDFTESDIEKRTIEIIESFIRYLDEVDLLAHES